MLFDYTISLLDYTTCCPTRTTTTNTEKYDTINAKIGLHEKLGSIIHLREDGRWTEIMPAIKDVKIVKDKVVIVFFVDGTQEKAVCAEGDTFSVENGISICLMKKLLNDMCGCSGAGIYNNLVRHAMKKVGAGKKKEEAEREKVKAEKAKRKKAHDDASERKKRDRQYLIDICADAITKALRDHFICLDDGK